MAAYTIVPIEHNIKQAITAAVKAIEFKKYHVENDEVVDNILKDIFRSLFPHSPDLVAVEKVEVVQIPIVGAANAAASAEPEPAPAPPAAEEKPKKKGGRPKKEKDAAAGEKEKKNLEKINPTQKKAMKKINDDVDAKDFLAYVNGLSEDEYKSKTFEDHVRAFVEPKKEDVQERVLLPVQFKGKEYFVDPETKKVYEAGDDVDKLVGHVGMLAFKDMVVPEKE
jgi:hypothetical protein